MQATRNGATAHQRSAAAPAESRTAKIAQSGIRTAEDLGNFASALISDAILGGVGIKEGNLAARGGSLLIRTTELQLKHGGESDIVMATQVNQPAESQHDPIAERERELLAELAQLAEAKRLRN